MTTPTQAPASTAGQLHHQLAGLFAEAFAKAVSAHAGAAWTSRHLPRIQPPPTRDAESSVVQLSLTGELAGELFLMLHAAASVELLAALQIPSPQEPGQAWLTLASAAREILLEAISPPFASLAVELCQLIAEPPADEAFAYLELASPAAGSAGAQISLIADAALLAALARMQAEANPSPEGDTPPADELSTHIERVIDVPLAVTLRFGQRHLTLREVLALSTGSLVELDRQVEEPVDLVLGDRLIARGEVVIVDGNYGLRVTEVLENAAQRLGRLGDGSEKASA